MGKKKDDERVTVDRVIHQLTHQGFCYTDPSDRPLLSRGAGDHYGAASLVVIAGEEQVFIVSVREATQEEIERAERLRRLEAVMESVEDLHRAAGQGVKDD